jgi:hypothetical protein
MKAAWSVVVVVVSAATLGFARTNTHTLEPRAEIGTRARVTEQRHSSIQLSWKSTGAGGGRTIESGTLQRYVEEVRQDRPLIVHREYELSTLTGKKGEDKKDRTSLHGREVLLEGFQLKPVGKFTVSPEDQRRLRFDRLCKALLPPQKVVSVRDSWGISSKALAAAIFPESVRGRCSAKVTFKRVKKRKGQLLACLKVRLELHQERVGKTPGIDMQLSGEIKWAIKEGAMAEAHLEGTIAYELKNTRVGQESRTGGKGPLRWSYKTEFLHSRQGASSKERQAGAHPPPGTQRLVCELNPAHVIPLTKYPRCLLCGEKLGKAFRCPKKCAWPWQCCPHDGAPFEAKAK